MEPQGWSGIVEASYYLATQESLCYHVTQGSGRGSVERSSQLLKGVLDMCLLAIIAEEPSYGYEMARKLEDRGLTLVGEGSIYPLLSRLQRDRLVETFTKDSPGGPPRKYYRIAGEGRRRLKGWIGEWKDLTSAVDSIIDGGNRG